MSGGQSLFSMPVDLTNLAKQIFSGGKSSSPTDDLAAPDKSSDTDSNSELHTDGANTDMDSNLGANPDSHITHSNTDTNIHTVTDPGEGSLDMGSPHTPATDEITLTETPTPTLPGNEVEGDGLIGTQVTMRENSGLKSGEVAARMRSCRSMSELEADLLAQLEAANQALESDNKSIQNVSPEIDRHTPLSGGDGDRKGSDTGSIKSLGSQSSQISAAHNTETIEEQEEERTPEQELVTTWSKILSDWDNVVKKRQQYIKDLVYKGVPQEFRCLVWQYLCGADNCPYKDKYAAYLKQTSACEKVIRRDIARTYPEHEFFMEKDGLGQESLFNVMKAYSLHDREVGYCQGSGFIVGLLLMMMPEEEAFSVLIQMMVTYRMRELFKPTMAELGTCMYQLEYLIQEHSAPLYQHFQAQSLHTSMYASGWFLTLFTTQLPLELSFRIMDRFLLEGMEIIFRIGVGMLLLGESDLLCMDMEGMLLYFQDRVCGLYSDPESAQALLDESNKVKYNAKRMKKLEKEYSLLKSKENEDQVELRRLRSENRLLRHRIENLEKENVQLADRLIQGQVTLAQEAEVMFATKRELSQLREQNKELLRSLSASEEQISELKIQKQPSIRPLFNRSVSVPAGQQPAPSGLYNHVRDLHTALNDLHRSMSVQASSESCVGDIESNEKFQALQEELIAVKLREAESNLALRELSNHVTELDKDWQKQQERTPKDKLSKTQTQALHEDLMSCKLRTADTDTANKQLRLRVMELETSGQITANQVQRMMDENERLRGDISSGRDREQNLTSESEELKNKITNIDSKSKEEAMVAKINDAEQSQLVAELRQRIAELEIANQEFQVTNEIINKPGQQNLKNEISDLKDELLQFKLSNNSMTFSTLDINKGDFDSLSDNEDSEKHNDLDLKLTSSAAINSSKSNNNTVHNIGVSNGVTNGVSNGTKPKQLTSMEMDAEDEPL